MDERELLIKLLERESLDTIFDIWRAQGDDERLSELVKALEIYEYGRQYLIGFS